MGTPDFNFSFLTATEANYAAALLDLFRGLALGLDTTVSNPPTGAIRWSSANSRWEKYNGTTWAALVSKYLIDVDTLDGLHAADLALVGHNHSATYQPLDAELTALARLTSAADKAPYFIGSEAAALMTVTAAARSLLDDTTVAAMRATLGAQTSDATLSALAALTTAADELIYATGSDTFSTCAFPAAARTLLAATTAALQRSALGLGSAATLTAGTAANNLLQLNASGQLPAVNGALLTGLAAAQISDLQTLPAGAVIFHASPTVPAGYLECNGAAVSRTAYAALFAAIGTTYGVGNGSTTFGLPDLRGEFLRGLDSGRGVDPSRALGSRQTGSIMGGDYDGVSGYSVLSSGAINPYTRAEVGLDAGVASDYPNALLSSAGQGNTYALTRLPLGWGVVRPRNVALQACIKY